MSSSLGIIQVLKSTDVRQQVSEKRLSGIGRSRDVTATAGPVDVSVLANGVLVGDILGLDQEGVGTEVITLGLEKVGR